MKNPIAKKSIVGVISAALIAAFTVALPSTASAADGCTDQNVIVGTKYVGFEKCTGVDGIGSKYEIRMPEKFNGMLFLYSHGLRNEVTIPVLPVLNETGKPITANREPEVGPNETVNEALLSQGYAIAGVGGRINGWAVPEVVESNLYLILMARDMYPKINKVVSWGDSLGGHISQSLSEKYGVIDATANIHMAGSAPSQYAYGGDILWLLKTYFDPTIKGGNYTQPAYAGDTRGYFEFLGDVQKLLVLLNALSTSIAANPVTPAWPATATTAPAALQGIPVRSAILLIGLLAGIPTQSKTYDASSGPAGALETTFGVAISPAVATLENIGRAIEFIVAVYDTEMKCGGGIYDNTKTDYATRIGDNSDVFAAALSGKSAIAGMLAFLNPLNPAAPRFKSSDASLACLASQSAYSGKITIPTITLSQTADPITPPGYVQKLKNDYDDYVSQGKTKSGLLLNIWQKTPDQYTVFNGLAAVSVPSTKATAGTNHSPFNNDQLLMLAKMIASSAKSGKLPSMATAKKAINNDNSLFIDPDYTPTLLPQEAN